MSEAYDPTLRCIAMLKSVAKDDPLFEVGSALLEAIVKTGGSCSLIRECVDPSELIQGLESRLKAKGVARGRRRGLFQTFQNLRSSVKTVNLFFVDSKMLRGIIYANPEDTKLIGLTLSEDVPSLTLPP